MGIKLFRMRSSLHKVIDTEKNVIIVSLVKIKLLGCVSWEYLRFSKIETSFPPSGHEVEYDYSKTYLN